MTARVAFLGNDPWSVPSLAALTATRSLDVVAVITNPPAVAGRGSKRTPTAVAQAAVRLGVPLMEVAGVGDGAGHQALVSCTPDILVVVAYGELLTAEVLALAPSGAVNLHFSLLPRWRGAAPVQRAILKGDAVTGVTVMLLDRGLDTGPILASVEESIRPSDDAASLGTRLSEIGAGLLVGTLQTFMSGGILPRPQASDGVAYAPKPSPEERVIDWSAPADAIVRRVRAFAPEPGVTTTFRATPLKVVQAEEAEGGGPAGTVVRSDKTGVVIAAGSGAVRPLTVAAAGRRRMVAADWARGVRIELGERFG